MVGAEQWGRWGQRHVVEEDMRGLACCLGGAVGRQRPDPGGSERAARARAVSAEKGRLDHRQVGPGPQ
jgi:hypothetical protein